MLPAVIAASMPSGVMGQDFAVQYIKVRLSATATLQGLQRLCSLLAYLHSCNGDILHTALLPPAGSLLM